MDPHRTVTLNDIAYTLTLSPNALHVILYPNFTPLVHPGGSFQLRLIFPTTLIYFFMQMIFPNSPNSFQLHCSFQLKKNLPNIFQLHLPTPRKSNNKKSYNL